jgi:DNA modification methylase
MTKHIVWYGNCLDFLREAEFPDGLHLAVTSPPYYNARDYSTYGSYNQYLMFIKKVSKAIYDRLVQGGHYCLNLTAVTETGGKGRKLYPTSTDALRLCQEIGFELVWDVAWMKPRGMPSNGGYNYENPYPFRMYLDSWREEIWVLRKGKERKVSKELLEKSRIEPRERVKELMCREWDMKPVLPASVGHPASYPIELPLRCIQMFSVVGDTVYDPFLGSGTTMLAAIKTGRNSYGTELTKKYLPIIYKRIGADQPRLTDDIQFEFVNIDVAEIRKLAVEQKKVAQEEKRKKAKEAAVQKKPSNGFSIMDFANR